MRANLLLAASILILLTRLAAQQPSAEPPASVVLQGMKSPKWAQREEAFGQATELLSSPETTPKDSDRLRLGIIQLLIHENSGGLKEPDNVTAENYGEGYGEDRSEYYAGLIEFAAHLDDERAIPALLGAASSGGMATRAVARFGKKALDPTLAQLKGRDSDLASGASFVIREMLEFRLVSDPDSHQRIKDALRSALHSPEFEVRVSAMGAIEYLDDREEFVPLLKEVAEHDPVKITSQRPDGGGDNGEFYPARLDARRLLRKIASHERPPIDGGLPPSEYQPVKP